MEEVGRPRAAKGGTRRRVAFISSALTAAVILGTSLSGVATASAATRHTAGGTGTLEICKAGSVSGSYNFTLNGGKPIAISVGTCLGETVTAGTNTVTELADPTGQTVLTAIKIVPHTALINKSIATQTVAVTVNSGQDVATTFTNAAAQGSLKVCKIAGDPSLLGQAFSFTEQAGAKNVGPFSVTAGPASPLNCSTLTSYQVGTQVNVAELASGFTNVSSIVVNGGAGSGESNLNLAAGTVTATVGSGVTEVIYTNMPIVNQTPGAIEVCKMAGDRFVTGYFTFTITGANGATTTQSVLAGQCTGDISEVPGPVIVTETPAFPYYVSGISAVPAGDLLSKNLADSTATFTVASGADTTAMFTNSTQTGLVKVCKTLASNSSALVGDTFWFSVSSSVGTQSVSVVAGPVGTTACTIDWTAIPLGTIATITEQGTPNVEVTGVSISPASQNMGSTGTTAVLSVGSGITSATFTNEALGWVEVCKNLSNQALNGSPAQLFTFSVNGGPTFKVQAGQCSQPFQVPAGTATVFEYSSANYQLVGVSTVSPTDPTGADLLSGPTANPAIVTVGFGGVGNETVVTFTNAVKQADFKICTNETSADANLAGQTANFSYSYTVDGVTSTGTLTLTIPAAPGIACSGLFGPINVVNANGSAVDVTVTETSVSATDVEVTSILYQGNGSVLSSTPTPAIPPASITYVLGSGINVTTFTNGRTP